MLRRRIVCGLTLALLVGPNAARAQSEIFADALRADQFGIHGPTYSHWLSAQRADLWRAGEEHLRVLGETGAGWARQDFWWGLVEPEPGRFVWEDFDRAIESYKRHNIKLFAILCYSSKWSQGAAPDTDEERERFANYVYQMVKRYKGRVAAWEIWNEPNILPFWSPRPDPELYAKLLGAAYAAAKRADPNCVIVGGALAGPDSEFLRGMYEHGAAGSFDVFSYHNYGQHNQIRTEWPEVEKLRAVMAEYGDGDKPIWHTENGFYTGPVGLSEQEQAARIVCYSVGLLALGVDRTFQLTLNDWSDDPKFHDMSSFRGLTHADYRKKRSFAAYHTMCARLANKRFVAAIRPDVGVSGFLFEEPRESVLVLWRAPGDEPRPATLDLGASSVLVQQMEGDWQRHGAETGVYTLPIGPEPVYVVNPGTRITNQRLVRWPNPIVTRIPREVNAKIEATVTNPTQKPLVLGLCPGQLSSELYESKEVAPGETVEVRVKVQASTLDVGQHEFMWVLAERGAVNPIARGFRLVEVESPLELAFGPLNRLDPDRPRLNVQIDYRGAQSAAGTLALQLDGKSSGAPVPITLEPGVVSRHALPLDLQPFASGRAASISVQLDSQGLKLAIDALRPLISAPPAPAEARVDGDLREWRALSPQIRPEMMSWEHINTRETPPPEDLLVTGWASYDRRGLWFAVEVRDDRLAFPESRAVWNWDSLQVGLDLGGDARSNAGYDDNDLEIELAEKPGSEDWCYVGAWPPGWPEEPLSRALQGVVTPQPEDGVVTYELLIPREVLVTSTTLAANTVIGFSIMVNDNDGDGRGGWQELTPGIGLGKRPSEFAWLWLR